MALPGAVHAGELDVSGNLDAGATSAADDAVAYGGLRVGYVLKPHLTVSLTGRTGGSSAGDRWHGALVGAVEIWKDLGRLRGAIKIGGTHQHEAPRGSLEERPGSVIGGVDDDISHRTAGVLALSLVANLHETQTGVIYAGGEVGAMLWADRAGPRWTYLGGLVAGFRVDLAGALR
jgi:hypothetical protein